MSDITQIADNVRRMKALFDALQTFDSDGVQMADDTVYELALYGYELARESEATIADTLKG